jgi:hypothetical protein
MPRPPTTVTRQARSSLDAPQILGPPDERRETLGPRAPRDGKARRLRPAGGRRSAGGVAPGDGELEPVAEAGHGADRAGAEDPSQARDLCRQVVLVDHEPRPDPLQQRGLGHQAAGILGEDRQQVEGACADLDRPAGARQPAFRWIELEGSDAYQVHSARAPLSCPPQARVRIPAPRVPPVAIAIL